VNPSWKYTYTVKWSDENRAYIGRCAEMPLLAAHGPSSLRTLVRIQDLVCGCIDDMLEQGEPIPCPTSD